MREYRARRGGYSSMSDEAKRKDTARSYASTYKKRGKIPKKPCEKCGDPSSQMHHHDYGRPLDVQWLCRACHVAWHKLILDLTKSTFRLWVAPVDVGNVKREAEAA